MLPGIINYQRSTCGSGDMSLPIKAIGNFIYPWEKRFARCGTVRGQVSDR